MSYLTRTVKNIWKVGIKDFGHQLQNIGDTKAGLLIGTDRFGNKFFENHEELPLRTRWVDYKNAEFNPDQIEPGWHAWMSYMIDNPPPSRTKGAAGNVAEGVEGTGDKLLSTGVRPWELSEHKPVMTLGRGAYRPYSTTKSKISSWTPVARDR